MTIKSMSIPIPEGVCAEKALLVLRPPAQLPMPTYSKEIFRPMPPSAGSGQIINLPTFSSSLSILPCSRFTPPSRARQLPMAPLFPQNTRHLLLDPVDVEWLAQIAVHPCGQKPISVSDHGMSSQSDNGQVTHGNEGCSPTDGLGGFEAIQKSASGHP